MFEARVAAIINHDGRVIELALLPESGASFVYRPGQHVSIVTNDGERRSYSMACRWRKGHFFELHIQRWIGGRFSDRLCAELKVGDRLQIEGPFGEIDWRQGRGPVVLVGTGTGLAPLKALIEHGMAEAPDRPMHLYWGARHAEDLYLSALLQRWAEKNDTFSFTPVLSRPTISWSGRRGYVQNAVAEDFPDLADIDIFACGSPAMIDDARRTLSALTGWNEDRFVTDAFGHTATWPDTAGEATMSTSVEFQGQTRRVPAAAGSTLLDALRAAGAPILSVCGGRASCGACKITVADHWIARLAPANRAERRLLAYLDGAGPRDRLACQIALTPEVGGLAVILRAEATAVWPECSLNRNGETA